MVLPRIFADSRRLLTVLGLWGRQDDGDTDDWVCAEYALARAQWPECRRIDRILVLAKEQNIRDQIAEEIRDDPKRYGIVDVLPRVGVIKDGWRWGQDQAIYQADVWVACVQQLFEINQVPRKNLRTRAFPIDRLRRAALRKRSNPEESSMRRKHRFASG